MIRLRAAALDTVEDVRAALQRALQLELSTLPPYLYALYSVGSNDEARFRIRDIVLEEMVHVAIVSNVLNAIGGTPVVADASVVPTYPGSLPDGIGDDGSAPFVVHLLPFSKSAMQQAMTIEEPEDPIEFTAALAATTFQTIGQFYAALRQRLRALDPSVWVTPPRNQIDGSTSFPGEFEIVANADDADKALERIASQGEGTARSPLDFELDIAHFYRFSEIERDQALEEAPDAPNGFVWGAPLGIDWSAAVDAIADPSTHDFSQDPTAAAAQQACDQAYTRMLTELHHAFNGEPDRLGDAVGAMFELRQAAIDAFDTPLAGSTKSAGPAFRFLPPATG